MTALDPILLSLPSMALKCWLRVHQLAAACASIERMMCGTLSYHLSWRPHASSLTAMHNNIRQNHMLGN